ncbi:pentapeptide repeat-containing protein [Micromonospora sp. NPDC048935]|uniref:pentapeptide repeat-containing protein n=1 Tax=Micromonospora sp. NPDC048935 TaxID=3364262 RepID=UPI0037209F68
MTRRLSLLLIAVGAAGLLGVLLAQVPASWWRVLASGWSVLLPATVSLALLLLGARLWWRTNQESHQASAAPTPPDRQMQPLHSWMILVGAVVVAVVTGAAVLWLQNTLPAAGDQVQRARLRVDSIRTGLTIGAAVTGAFALLLAVRRQQLAERTQQATEYDAGEKRVTELYVKAADQLGADKAPVRLAGLYALERLAQDNPVHRQSIVEVICAYLRMPYTPPDDHSAPGTDHPSPAGETSTGPGSQVQTADTDDAGEPATGAREEHQVRLAAQRILARHLRPGTENEAANPSYWGPRIVLDLTEATLIDADFTECHLHNATFGRVTFIGRAEFNRATFSGSAVFGGATFRGSAVFGGATFRGGAVFGGATFRGGAVFIGATFRSVALFGRATFGGGATFSGATFSAGVTFDGATFCGGAGFEKATFNGGVTFNGATFNGDALLVKATFNGDALLVRVTFNGDAWFENATFNGDAGFGLASFNGDAFFDGASFSGDPFFDGATLRRSEYGGPQIVGGLAVGERSDDEAPPAGAAGSGMAGD